MLYTLPTSYFLLTCQSKAIRSTLWKRSYLPSPYNVYHKDGNDNIKPTYSSQFPTLLFYMMTMMMVVIEIEIVLYCTADDGGTESNGMERNEQ